MGLVKEKIQDVQEDSSVIYQDPMNKMLTMVGVNLFTYVRNNWSGTQLDANERDTQFEEYA